MEKNRSVKYLKKRKFLLVLPLLALPFSSVIFGLMGGGRTSAATLSDDGSKGLNVELPDAKNDAKKGMTKMSFYEQAMEDSMRLRQEKLNDPYYQNRLDTLGVPVNRVVVVDPQSGLNNKSFSNGSSEYTTSKIYERLHQLDKVVRNTEGPQSKAGTEKAHPSKQDLSSDMEKLEGMLEGIHRGAEDDPELKELNTMLDKVLDVQHPERVKSRINGERGQGKGSSLQIHPTKKEEGYFFGSPNDAARTKKNAFYSQSLSTSGSEYSNAVWAEVFGSQVVSSGSTVKLRLLSDCDLKERVLTKGSFIYAVASVQGDRLQLEIPSVRQGSSLLNLSLQAYDLDGLAGVFVQGAETADALNNGWQQQLGSFEIGSYEPSFKSQVTANGLQTVKDLLNKKTKRVKVTLKAGYRLLLKNKS